MGQLLGCNIPIEALIPTTWHDHHLHLVLCLQSMHPVCARAWRVILLPPSALVGPLK